MNKNIWSRENSTGILSYELYYSLYTNVIFHYRMNHTIYTYNVTRHNKESFPLILC